MRHWLDVCFTEGGLMVAQQKLHKRPLLVSIHLHKISSLWLSESKDLVFDCKQANISQRQFIVHIILIIQVSQMLEEWLNHYRR